MSSSHCSAHTLPSINLRPETISLQNPNCHDDNMSSCMSVCTCMWWPGRPRRPESPSPAAAPCRGWAPRAWCHACRPLQTPGGSCPGSRAAAPRCQCRCHCSRRSALPSACHRHVQALAHVRRAYSIVCHALQPSAGGAWEEQEARPHVTAATRLPGIVQALLIAIEHQVSGTVLCADSTMMLTVYVHVHRRCEVRQHEQCCCHGTRLVAGEVSMHSADQSLASPCTA